MAKNFSDYDLNLKGYLLVEIILVVRDIPYSFLD